MKYHPDKHHRRSIRLKGHNYSAPGVYFITICVHQRECLLGEIVSGEMTLNQFGQLVWSHWHNLPRHHPRLQLDAFVVMPNHIHGILTLKDNPKNEVAMSPCHSLSEIIRGFKTFSARRINQIRRSPGVPVWQRNYYEHIIQNAAALNTIHQYITDNPKSWGFDQLHPNHPSKQIVPYSGRDAIN